MEKKFIIKLFDGDMYILTGYQSEDEILQKFEGLEWVRMPNGARVKASSIAKVQSFDDYQFQSDQKARHKQGQYLSHDTRSWRDHAGEIAPSHVQSITGILQSISHKLLDEKKGEIIGG